jgi:type IX secretion system PorP/SprF family membrane protein
MLSVFLAGGTAAGQQTPLDPLSYWVFTPYIYNPAMVGSKDYLSLDFNAAWQGDSRTQLLGGHARLSKARPGYFSSAKLREFKGFGIGGSVFNDIRETSHNTGASFAASYQIPLNTKNLSFLSFGAAVKGVYNMMDTSSTDSESKTRNLFYPNADAGIYYYGTNFFTGISGINLMGNPEDPDSLGNYIIPVSRQYFFTIGYKFVLSKKHDIVLEPSLLVNAVDSTFDDLAQMKDNIDPVIKLYLDDFCFGSYFLMDGNTSLFIEYRFPRFHLGALCQLPRNTPYYKKPPILEFTAGFNFQVDKSGYSKRSVW